MNDLFKKIASVVTASSMMFTCVGPMPSSASGRGKGKAVNVANNKKKKKNHKPGSVGAGLSTEQQEEVGRIVERSKNCRGDNRLLPSVMPNLSAQEISQRMSQMQSGIVAQQPALSDAAIRLRNHAEEVLKKPDFEFVGDDEEKEDKDTEQQERSKEAKSSIEDVVFVGDVEEKEAEETAQQEDTPKKEAEGEGEVEGTDETVVDVENPQQNEEDKAEESTVGDAQTEIVDVEKPQQDEEDNAGESTVVDTQPKEDNEEDSSLQGDVVVTEENTENEEKVNDGNLTNKVDKPILSKPRLKKKTTTNNRKIARRVLVAGLGAAAVGATAYYAYNNPDKVNAVWNGVKDGAVETCDYVKVTVLPSVAEKTSHAYNVALSKLAGVPEKTKQIYGATISGLKGCWNWLLGKVSPALNRLFNR